MKFQGPSGFKSGAQSPPARGAWIEISRLGIAKEHVLESPPARGAWIEIPVPAYDPVGTESPPARGAWIEIARGGKAGPEPPVAPRTGGVD